MHYRVFSLPNASSIFQSLSHPKATLHFRAWVKVYCMLKTAGTWFLRMLSALTFHERILTSKLLERKEVMHWLKNLCFFLVLSNFILKWMSSGDICNYTHRYMNHLLCQDELLYFLALFKLSIYNIMYMYNIPIYMIFLRSLKAI